MNAVVDALAPLGVDHIEMPVDGGTDMAGDQSATEAMSAMIRPCRLVCALAAALVMLAACGKFVASTFPQTSVVGEANVFPRNWRSDIVAYLRNYLNDPTGVRGAFISEPSLKQLVQVQRYASCVRYNAKKSTGEYEGSRDRVVVFLAGRLDTMVLARGDQCRAWPGSHFPRSRS